MGAVSKKIMSLETKARQILNDFDGSSSEEILDLLNQIQDSFKNQITKDYLKGKMGAISDSVSEEERKKLCKNLKPYLDWYLQGL
ncbi:MAG: hypothetical protein PVI88_04460 [Nitrosopumilaceae archaeon]|jgi:hypothetical protein